jgi:hypothetical protein
MYVNNLLQKETERIKDLMSEQIFLGGPAMGLSSPKNVMGTINWMKSWDKHDWLNFVEITTSLLAVIPQPAAPVTSPILLGISTGAGVANAVGYFKEGDKYTAGLILAFSIIPAGQLISTLKGSKAFMKLGPAKSIQVINAVKSGTATANEVKIAQELVKEVAPHADKLAKQTMTYTIKKTLQELPKKSLSFVIKLCLIMYRLGVFGIKAGVTIGGTFLSYDLMYRALNYKNKKNMSLREKNEMAKSYDLIMNNEDEIIKLSVDDIKKNESSLLEHSDSFISIDTTHEIKF